MCTIGQSVVKKLNNNSIFYMGFTHTQRCWEGRHEPPIMVTAIKGDLNGQETYFVVYPFLGIWNFYQANVLLKNKWPFSFCHLGAYGSVLGIGLLKQQICQEGCSPRLCHLLLAKSGVFWNQSYHTASLLKTEGVYARDEMNCILGRDVLMYTKQKTQWLLVANRTKPE